MMKPIQQHKDSQITNISFDNFTGSICIITSLSDDKNTNNFMLSSPQINSNNSNTNDDIYIPNHHHLTLLTEPTLGARSRRKNQINSITNTRRNSYNDPSSIILPNNQLEKLHYEKKNNFHESSDSGLDLSLSTNSSVQYSQQQQHITIHRPLSALNEDLNTDDTIRFPILNLEHNRSIENHSNTLSDKQDKIIKKSNDTLTENHQQYQSLNDLTNKIFSNSNRFLSKSNLSVIKPLRKKTKLNSIPELSLYFNINDEHTHSITRTTSSSSNQTTSHSIKSKAITPLGYYPNQEQIRAHINRSVIERQHPSYIPISTRKNSIKQTIPFHNSLSNINNILVRQSKLSNLHIQENDLDESINMPSLQQTKQIIDEHQNKRNQNEKKCLNKMNKFQENSLHKQQIKENQIENFLTSTPRHYYEYYNDNNNNQQQISKNFSRNITDKKFKHNQSNDSKFKRQNDNNNNNINQQHQSTNLAYRSKLTRLNIPVQSRSTKPNPISNMQYHIEQKSSIESMNNLLQTTRIQPRNFNKIQKEQKHNHLNNISKIDSKQFNKIQKNSNRFYQTKSPTSRSIISNQQQYTLYESSSSSSSSNKSLNTIPIDDEQLLDGRYVIPGDNSQYSPYIDSSSQTSSHHTYPFICTPDSNHINNVLIDKSLHKLNTSDNIIDHQTSSSSSLEQFSPNNRFPLPLGKVTISMEKDDISTNYDSDDGWSDDSAELIYIDEHYLTQKKKIISPLSSSSSSS